MRGLAARDRQPSCSMVMVRPVTCGCPLPRSSPATTPLLFPICAGWGSPPPRRFYDKKTQGQDVAGLLDALGIKQADLVTHDIGNMVGYAFAAQYPSRVTRFAIMDAPLPGIGPWEEVLKSPLLWHFRFGGPDMERLVAGRERIYLDRFWNEFSADPKSFGKVSRGPLDDPEFVLPPVAYLAGQ
jgi:pimeloyl-ACP methyl ester carboxylesterase